MNVEVAMLQVNFDMSPLLSGDKITSLGIGIFYFGDGGVNFVL